jgi:hypothetical protein
MEALLYRNLLVLVDILPSDTILVISSHVVDRGGLTWCHVWIPRDTPHMDNRRIRTRPSILDRVKVSSPFKKDLRGKVKIFQIHPIAQHHDGRTYSQ